MHAHEHTLCTSGVFALAAPLFPSPSGQDHFLPVLSSPNKMEVLLPPPPDPLHKDCRGPLWWPRVSEVPPPACLFPPQMVTCALPPQEVLPFLCTLLERLRAGSISCGWSALRWFQVAVTNQGQELRDKVRQDVAGWVQAAACLLL